MGDEAEKEEALSKTYLALKFVWHIYFVCPFLLFLCSCGCGVILAAVEQWSLVNGIYYIISVICGLAQPLTNNSPVSALGMSFASASASWSLGISGIIVGWVMNGPYTDCAVAVITRVSGASEGHD